MSKFKPDETRGGGQPISRRGFVRLSLGGAVASAMGLPLLLEACGSAAAPASSPAAPASSAAAASAASGSAPASAAASGGALKLPTYAPVNGPRPDLPGSTNGVPPAYLSFPKNLVKSVSAAPGKGGDVTSMFYVITGTPPTPMDQNDSWQAVNKAVNATMKNTYVAYADYPTRLATILAGGDVPDMLCISVLGSLFQGMPAFLASKCEDLTPFLSGDAVKAYPNLAALPSEAWRTTVFNKKIYCVPQADVSLGRDLLSNGKELASVGASASSFKNTDDFTKVAKDLTKPGTHWAIGSNILTWTLMVFRAPNDWRESGGKLTKDIETAEYKEAVAYLRGLWDAGVIWPDTPSASVNTLASNFYAGKYTYWPNLFLAFPGAYDGTYTQNPQFDLRPVVPFGHDGGKGVQFLSAPSVGLTALKQGSPDRIKELLGILNYLAAPFGSEEELLVNYGIKDQDYKLDSKGNPVVTPKGRTALVPWAGLVRHTPVLYDANHPEAAKVAHDSEVKAADIGIQSPVVGLYSNTYASKGASLNRTFTDGVNQILYGRTPVSSLDGLISSWRKNGGDQIRAEYEQALQDRG
ncbi:MAG: extracellular solute-binding protein [Chloroflexota bacterium]